MTTQPLDTSDQDATVTQETLADPDAHLTWRLLNADEAMRARLRALATPPWPENEPPEEELERMLAPILLGLLRDEEAIDILIALVPYSQDQDLDSVADDCPIALAAIGRPIVPSVIRRMREIERSGKLFIPRVGAIDDTHVYWTLARSLAFLASTDRGTHREIVPFFRERIARLEIPPEDLEKATDATVWIDVASSARIPEIDAMIRTFLESLPAGYCSEDFGTAADCLADLAPERIGVDPRTELEASYRTTIERFAANTLLNPETSKLDRDACFAHLVEGTGPFSPDIFDSIVATPELLAMLRDTVAPPWEHSDAASGEVRVGTPVSAAFMLGLHGSLEDAELFLKALRVAVAEEFDWMLDVVPLALAALGPGVLGALTARIEALESAADEDGSLMEMGHLISAAGNVASAWPEAVEPFVAFAVPRIGDPANDARSTGERGVLTIAETWVMAAYEVVDPRLESAILGFFDRVGDTGAHFDIGDRYDYLERPSNTRRFDPRFWLGYRFLDYDRQLRKPTPPPRLSANEGDDLSMRRVDADAFREYLKRLDENAEPEPAPTVARAAPKIGRNDPCTCGSGKKYKKCCGK